MGLHTQSLKKQDIIFDKVTHKYYHNNQELTSVTTWINEYFSHDFNSLFASINKAKKNKSTDNGITNPNTLRHYWHLQGERAALIGSATHNFAEMYHLDRNTPALTGYEHAVVNAYRTLTTKWKILNMEQIVFDTNYLLAGCIDMVLQNIETGEIGIADWKTTTDMHKSYNKFKEELKTTQDTPLNRYAIQLQLYNIIGKFNASHSNLFVIQLMNDGNYKVYSAKSPSPNTLNDYSEQLLNALNKRKLTTTHPLLSI